MKICELVKDGDIDVVKEVVWTISNCLSGSDFETCVQLARMGVLEAICHVIANYGHKMLLGVALEGLAQAFAHGDIIKQIGEKNIFVDAFNRIGGLELLEKLQNHNDEDIYRSAVNLLETYYKVNEQR